MSRLADAGIVNLVWEEDDDGIVTATGLQYYEIDNNNEVAIFHDDECVRVVECVDLGHACATVLGGEAVCRQNIKYGKTGNGNTINEKGWDLGRRA